MINKVCDKCGSIDNVHSYNVNESPLVVRISHFQCYGDAMLQVSVIELCCKCKDMIQLQYKEEILKHLKNCRKQGWYL
jgi:hypothetical protein